jgi:hypothetical protein
MEDKLNSVLNKYGKEMVSILKKQVSKSKLVVTGNTINSIKHSVKGSTLTITASNVLGILDAGIPKGRKVNVTAIVDWMKRKNIRPRDGRKGSGRFVKTTERNMRSSAWLIARYISKNGTIKRFGHKGSDVINNSIGIKNEINQRMRKELKDVTRKRIKLLFKQN